MLTSRGPLLAPLLQSEIELLNMRPAKGLRHTRLLFVSLRDVRRAADDLLPVVVELARVSASERNSGESHCGTCNSAAHLLRICRVGFNRLALSLASIAAILRGEVFVVHSKEKKAHDGSGHR